MNKSQTGALTKKELADGLTKWLKMNQFERSKELWADHLEAVGVRENHTVGLGSRSLESPPSSSSRRVVSLRPGLEIGWGDGPRQDLPGNVS